MSVAGSLQLSGTTLSLVNDSAAPGATYYYGTDASGTKGWFALSTEGVNSLTGTANQVVVSASTGSVTLSLASTLASINSITSAAGQNLVLATGTGGTALTIASSTLAATFAGTVTASGSAVGAFDIAVRNTNAGESYSTFKLGNDTTATLGVLYAFGSGWTTSGAYVKSGVTLESSGVGGITLLAGSASGTVRVYAGNALAATFNTSQGLSIAGTTASSSTSTGALVVSGGVGVAGAAYIGGLLSVTGLISGGGSCQITGNVTTSSSGGLTLKTGVLAGTPSSATDAFIGVHNTGGPGSAAGDLIYIPRSSSGGNYAHRFFTEATGTPTLRLQIDSSGLTLGSASSITAAASTNLTLAGGSSGASLVLGQGANGNITLTPAGTGLVTSALRIRATGGGDPDSTVTGAYLSVSGSSARLSLTDAAGTSGARVADLVFITATGNVALRFRNDAASSATKAYQINGAVGAIGNHSWFTGSEVESMRLAGSTGNLLIGGTTDISGSGGLKVFGTTAATSTTTGAFQCAGGAGIAGALYAGGNLTLSGSDPTYFFGGTAYYFRTATSSGDMTFVLNNSTALTLSNGTNNATVAGDLTVSGGNVGVGTAALANYGIDIRPTALSGVGQAGINIVNAFTSTATSFGYGIRIVPGTAAAAFTTTLGAGVFVDTPSLGVASAITTQAGLSIANQGATGITNAYGIDIAAQSGALTTNVGLRNAGTTLLTNATASTSTSTGALVVSGGVGVAGDQYLGGSLYFTDTRIYRNAANQLRLDTSLLLGTTTVATPRLQLAGTYSSSAWGTSGIGLRVTQSGTDTSSSGTVASMVVHSVSAGSFIASNATVYTDAATLYVAGAPTASTNVTITNNWGLWNVGKTRCDDDIEVTSSSSGVILRAPSGSRYRVTVANDGSLTTTAV